MELTALIAPAAAACSVVGGAFTAARFCYLHWRSYETACREKERLQHANAVLENEKLELGREQDAVKAALASARQKASTAIARFTQANTTAQKLKDAYERANATIRELKEKLQEAKSDNTELLKRDAIIAELNGQLVEKKHQIEKHQKTQIDLTKELEEQRNTVIELEAMKSTLSAQLDAANKRISDLSTFDGTLWDRPLPKDGPKFRPLRSRSMPIISVLNFKGGVGKTSITANLAGILGRLKKSVLMVDLDYQRSLSQLILDDHTRALLQAKGHVLQKFLAGTSHDTATLLEMIHNADQRMQGCSVLTNSHAFNVKQWTESLEETENFLMAEWIIKHESTSDVRLHLREALHGIGIESHFDYVFLDCPPRITTSTINALAASDYVLVPVVPDHVSATSVLPLIASVRRLRSIFPELKILGVVANQAKFHGGKMIQREMLVWDKLKVECNQAFKDIQVPFFEAIVPLHHAFESGPIKDRNHLAIEDASIYDIFQKLTKEIQKEIASHETSQPTPVLV